MSNRTEPYMLAPQQPRSRSDRYKVHVSNLDIINRSDRELKVLLYIFSCFALSKFPRSVECKITKRKIIPPNTYDHTFQNQTLVFKYSHSINMNIEINKTKLKGFILKFTNEGILKKVGPSRYLINPLYAENIKDGQSKFADDIIAKEFGV